MSAGGVGVRDERTSTAIRVIAIAAVVLMVAVVAFLLLGGGGATG